MKKVKLSISVNSIYFSFTNLVNDENINQTSYIETGNLLFEYEYIIKNHKIVSSFLKDITNQTKIDTIKIKSIQLVPLILKIIKNNPTIKKIYILDNKVVDSNSFLAIVDNKYIKYLNCYNLPGVMFNYLVSRKNIDIDIRDEIPYSSTFVEDNKLNKYNTIFYKKYIVINKQLSERDLKDFETFLIINQNLQTINIKKYDLENLKNIQQLLKKYNKVKVKINIHQDKNNLETIYKDIEEIKKLKTKNINIKISYNKDYVFKNLFKQLNITIIRFSVLAIFISLLLILGITEYTSAKEDKETSQMVEEITDIMNILDIPEDIESNHVDETPDAETGFNDDTMLDEVEVNSGTSTTPAKPNVYKTKYEKVFTKLKEINKDTVGWLTVKNTDVDYPVVQSKDNDYYLKHSFDNKYNTRGWVFADYRNSFDTFNDNTIIYGHNLKSGYMFGTLQKVLASSWYNNQDNRKIIFNTENGNHEWQIFSIYTMPKNNDYLVSTFANETNFNNYIKLSKERSIIDFGVDVKYGDNILTLSTCYIDSEHRLIIQAKLIK